MFLARGFFAIALLLSTELIAFSQTNTDPAQFKGDWLGSGVYRLNGVQTFCRNFAMKFDGNRYLMNFLGGQRNCEQHDETFVSVSMAHNNGKLFYNGQEVGTLRGNLLEVRFSQPEGNGRVRHWRMSMRREGDTIVYEESRTMDSETTPMISFAGVIAKQR